MIRHVGFASGERELVGRERERERERWRDGCGSSIGIVSCRNARASRHLAWPNQEDFDNPAFATKTRCLSLKPQVALERPVNNNPTLEKQMLFCAILSNRAIPIFHNVVSLQKKQHWLGKQYIVFFSQHAAITEGIRHV